MQLSQAIQRDLNSTSLSIDVALSSIQLCISPPATDLVYNINYPGDTTEPECPPQQQPAESRRPATPPWRKPLQTRHQPLPSHVTRRTMVCLAKFGGTGTGKGKFSEVGGVAVKVSPCGAFTTLAVTDTNNQRVQLFDLHGNFLRVFHSSVDTLPHFCNRVAFPEAYNYMAVTNRGAGARPRVQIYTMLGKPLQTFGQGTLKYPRAIAVDHEENVIVLESHAVRVVIFLPRGRGVLSSFQPLGMDFPNSVAVNKQRELFLSNNLGHNVVVFSYFGQRLRQIGGPGVTNHPIAVCIDNRGRVVVASNYNSFCLTVFTQEGDLVAGYQSSLTHDHCTDVALTRDGVAVVTSVDNHVYCYGYGRIAISGRA